MRKNLCSVLRAWPAWRRYRNTSKEQPYATARHVRSQLLYSRAHSRAELLQAIESATLEDVCDFAERTLLDAADVESFVFGNVDPSEAEGLTQCVREAMILGGTGLPPSDAPDSRVVMLAQGTDYVYCAPHANPEEVNCGASPNPSCPPLH